MVRLVALLLALPLALVGQITLDWDDDEVTQITWSGDNYAQNVNAGTPFCCWIGYADAQSYTPFDSSPSSKTENVDGWSHTYRPGTDYELGVDVVFSQPCDDCIDMEITISNDGTQAIDYVAMLPLELTNPGVNTSNCNAIDRVAGAAYGPVTEIKGSWGKWVLWHEDFDGFWSVRIPCPGDATVNFDVQFGSGSTLVLDDGVTSIGVGASKTITLHMKFAAEDDAATDVAPTAYEAWRAQYPIRYKQADARPWLSWFMSSESNVDADGVGVDNPRGYIHFTDWTDEATVYTAMLAKADEIVSRASGMSPKAQGVILWDIEGSEFAHSMTYVGDPTAVCPAGTADDTTGISPEMCYDNGTGELLIDAIMRKFREGGLRIGVTLRPQSIQYGTELPATCTTTGAFDATFATADFTDAFVDLDRALTPRGNRGCRCADDGVSWVCNYNLFWQIHFETQDEVIAELRRKIQYAYGRWGVTAYYMDTNSLSGTYWHGIFYQLSKEFPDVLLMPEWEEPTYMACCKPYDQLNANVTGPTQAELDLHAAGAVFLNIQDGDRDANAAALRLGMRHGSPVMVRGWFNSPSEQAFAPTQYALAVQENGVVTLSTGERYETTIPIVERAGGSCYPNHLAVRFASGTETLNGCNIFTGQGCGSTELCRSFDSPCTISDTTAYRLEFHSALQKTCSAGRIGPRLIELASAGGRISVNPITGQLAFDKLVGSYFEVHTADADGSNVTCISCDHADLPTRHIGNPVWSPDGEWIVMQAQKSAATTTDALSTPGIGVFNDLYAYEVDTDTATLIHSVTLTIPAQGLLHPQFNHAGDKLMWAEMTDGSGGFNGTWEITIADWSPVTPSLSNLTDYTPDSQTFYETHGWSPDDSLILYTAAVTSFDNLDIYTWDLSGSSSNLTSGSTYWDEHAHFSHDGDKIVWMSSREQSLSPLQTDYWIMDADGSNKVRLTNFSNTLSDDYQGYNAIASDFDWSRDDRIIGYVQQTGASPDSGKLLSISVFGGDPPRFADAAATTCTGDGVQTGDACDPFGGALDLLLGSTDR